MSPVPRLALPLIVAPSRRVCCKNPPDDHSFVFDNFELAGFARYRSISVGTSSRMSAMAYHAGHPAADLLRAVLALHLSGSYLVAVHPVKSKWRVFSNQAVV